jgi:hypothetical protein
MITEATCHLQWLKMDVLNVASIAKYRTCRQPNQWLIWIFRFSSNVQEMICLEYFLAMTIRQGHGNSCHH